jgi:quercetin dioxygenase-like cupin family protein
MNRYSEIAKQGIVLTVAIVLVLAATALVSQRSYATPSSGVTAALVAAGKLDEAIRVKLKDDGIGFGNGQLINNLTLIRLIGEPGAQFGWHQHSGPHWVLVTAGTVTYYDVEGGTCNAKVYPTGSAFLDPGNKTHTARNEGSDPVEVYVFNMLPEGGASRIDLPDPGICQFP